MGFLRRLVGGGDEPPDWSPFDDAGAWRTFLEMTKADLARRGLRTKTSRDYIEVDTPDPNQVGRYGLSNVAQLCAPEPVGAWAAIIESHFDKLLNARARDGGQQVFEEVRDRLRVRLVAADSQGGGYPETWALRRPAEGLLAMLAVDNPDTVTILDVSEVEAWPVDVDEAHSIAIRNTAAEDMPNPSPMGPDGDPTRLYLGAGMYVASAVLFLDALLVDGTHDALVAVPSRGALIVREFHDSSFVADMGALAGVVEDLHREGPGSISPWLYWWHDGNLAAIPGRFERGSYNIAPPDEFMKRLAELDG